MKGKCQWRRRESHCIIFALAIASFVFNSTLIGQTEFDLREREARVKVLIEMLVSRNATNGDGPTMEKEYDRNLQVPVILAANQLLREDLGAMKALLAVDEKDPRYSFSMISASGRKNLTLGNVANLILNRMINVAQQNPNFWLIPQSPAGIRDWIRLQGTGSSASLHSLQLAAVTEQIRRLEERLYEPGVIKNHHLRELSKKEFQEQKDAMLKDLVRLQKQLTESNRPIAVETLSVVGFQVWGVPWNGIEPPL